MAGGMQSAVLARRADLGVAVWSDLMDAPTLFLSAITIHELELGVRLMERITASTAVPSGTIRSSPVCMRQAPRAVEKRQPQGSCSGAPRARG